MTATHTASSATRNGVPRSTAAAPVSGPVAGRTRRQRQLPWIGAGMLLIVSSTIGFALWTTSQNERTPILIASHDLTAGTTLAAGHVEVSTIALDPGITIPTSGDYESMLGATLTTDLPAGTPLLPSHLQVTGITIPDGHALVGATLGPGATPTLNLAPGTPVHVVATSPTADDGGVIATATVWADEPLIGATGGQRFITLLVNETDSARVADVANGGGLRLIQLPDTPGGTEGEGT